MNRKYIAGLLMALLLVAPLTTFAYTVSGGARSYSAPARSYSAPIRSYSAPIRTYSAPRTYSVPVRTYTAPKTNYTVTPSVKPIVAPVRTSPVPKVSSSPSPVIVNNGTPWYQNFFLWYWFFGRPQPVNHTTVINSVASTTATSTRR